MAGTKLHIPTLVNRRYSFAVLQAILTERRIRDISPGAASDIFLRQVLKVGIRTF
jgi:hypothetical protein